MPGQKPAGEGVPSGGKVLFIDDEKNILNSIRREFMETDVEVFCAMNGTEGLQILQEHPIDIVVSDYRMPEMDGYQFLKTVKEAYPGINRVMLSGFLDQKLLIRAISSGLAATYFTKPWDEQVLRQKVEHLLQVRAILKSKSLLSTINSIEKLPTLPSLLQQMSRAMDGKQPVRDVTGWLEKDPAVAAKILQVANSAFMGTKKIRVLKDALDVLGLDAVKDILLSVSVINEQHPAALLMADYEMYFLIMALVNYFLPLFYKSIYKKELNHGFPSVGLVFDIGILIMISQLPERYHKLLQDQNKHPDTGLDKIELALGYEGCTHAELGGYFLDLWSLPGVLVEAALFHHDPGRASPENRGVIQLLSYTSRLIEHIWKHRYAARQDFSAFYLEKVPEDTLNSLFDEVQSAIRQYSSATYKSLYKRDLGARG